MPTRRMSSPDGGNSNGLAVGTGMIYTLDANARNGKSLKLIGRGGNPFWG